MWEILDAYLNVAWAALQVVLGIYFSRPIRNNFLGKYTCARDRCSGRRCTETDTIHSKIGTDLAWKWYYSHGPALFVWGAKFNKTSRNERGSASTFLVQVYVCRGILNGRDKCWKTQYRKNVSSYLWLLNKTFFQRFFSPPSIPYRRTLEIYDLKNFKVGTNNFGKFSPETLS